MGDHRRFFVPPEQIDGDLARLDGALARQLRKVLRLREGDRICLLDGSGCEHNAVITALSKSELEARIESTRLCPAEPRLKLTLAMCLPKSDRMELIVQKGTELGISQYVIAHSERTIARPDASKTADRLERWRRIAAEAAEQCGRGLVPELQGIVGFGELTRMASDFPLALVAWECEGRTALKDALRSGPDADRVMLMVGPEGGLTEHEVEQAKEAGARCVSLGKRVLRAETAAIAACAAIMYELDGEL